MAERTAQYTGQIYNVSVVYNIYRVVLPLVLLATYVANPETAPLGALDPELFVQVSATYAIFGIVVAFFTPSGRGIVKVSQFLTGTLIVDILATTLLIYSCGGISSGLGLLLIVTIASGSILIRGRISTFLAAVAAKAMADDFLLEKHLEQIEIEAIENALKETRWNKTAAAKKLGMSFRSLRYRLKKLGLD